MVSQRQQQIEQRLRGDEVEALTLRIKMWLIE